VELKDPRGLNWYKGSPNLLRMQYKNSFMKAPDHKSCGSVQPFAHGLFNCV
jgi:hypothetical protein